MGQENGKITRKTWLPLGLVIIIAGACISFAVYITKVDNKAIAASKGVSELKNDIKDLPTKTDYIYLKEGIDDLKKDVKSLLKR
jgi:hypothetical protein